MQERLRQLSLSRKIDLCCGKNFWETLELPEIGLPSLFMCDGPHGLRKQDFDRGHDQMGINRSLPATCFPTAVTTSGSFDPDLLEKVGRAIAREALALGVGLVLGPGLNIKRDPRCGRNFEYFSEDPLLSGKLAAGFVRGVQGEGVGACLKHYAVNNQETDRHVSNSVIDRRTLHELYLKGFQIAIQESAPACVMSSYNMINGIYASDHEYLLNDVLRKAWGYRGFVVTDWGGMHDRVAAFCAGNDLLMPGGSDYMRRAVLDAVKSGELQEADIDRSALRVAEAVQRLSREGKERPPADFDAHHELAREAAEQGAVLLQNDGLLPLHRDNHSIGLIGRMAEYPRYQGAGSSHINPTHLDKLTDIMPYARYAEGYLADGSTDEKLIQDAVACAMNSDVSIVLLGLPDNYESEGFDRDHLDLPQGQLDLLEAVCRVTDRVAVVLFAGSAVTVPFGDDVSAILFMGLPGQAWGGAVKNLLYGQANPAGKLSETWPLRYADAPTAAHFGTTDALYKEGLYVGYRYYATADKDVRYPFGHGLSYTSFELSDLEVHAKSVSVKVQNTGERNGAEVVQLYLRGEHTQVYRPALELKGFQKVWLKPGETKRVRFELTPDLVAVWQDGWRVEKGTYTFAVGTSSRDLPLSFTFDFDGVALQADTTGGRSWYRILEGTPAGEDWERLLGRPYEPQPVRHRGEFTMNDTVNHMKDESKFMRFFYKIIEKVILRGIDGPRPRTTPEFRMMMAASAGSPLRSLQMTSGIKGRFVRAVLALANGRTGRAFLELFRK